jgi:hypothetical protein
LYREAGQRYGRIAAMHDLDDLGFRERRIPPVREEIAFAIEAPIERLVD